MSSRASRGGARRTGWAAGLALALSACGSPGPSGPDQPAPAPPYLVKDIRPGVASSAPNVLAVVGGRLYLSADDGLHG